MRIAVCAVVLSVVIVLSGCGGGPRPTSGPNDDWVIGFALTGFGYPYWETTPTYVGTRAAASDGLDAADRRTPDAVIPEDAFVTSLRPDLPDGEYIEDIHAPIAPGQVKTWRLQVPPSGIGQQDLYAWNPAEHDVNGTISIALKDDAGNVLWVWDSSKNGTQREPARHITVRPGSQLLLQAGPVSE